MTTQLHGFGQFLSFLPHQFGFVPDRSVIVAAMSGTQVVTTLRLDDDAPVLTGHDLDALRPLLQRATRRVSDVTLVVVEYRVEIGAVRSQPLVQYLDEHVAPVQHVFVVAGDVWWATRCEQGCCDGALHELDSEGVAQKAVEAGLGAEPRSSRQAAAADLRSVDSGRADEVARCLGDSSDVDARGALEDWEGVLTTDQPSAAVLARVLAACADPVQRDRFLWTLVPELAPAGQLRRDTCGRWDEQRVEELATVVVEGLERALPAVSGPVRATWLAFLCLARWRAGDQTGAGLAAEEAVAVGSHTHLVNIVATIIHEGIPYPRAPVASEWPEAAGF